MTAYREPAGEADDEKGPPLYLTDSALVGAGATRWRIQFLKKAGDLERVFSVTEYQAARRWWGAIDTTRPMREVGTTIVRGFGSVNWHDANGYTVGEELMHHLRAAEKRQGWVESEGRAR